MQVLNDTTSVLTNTSPHHDNDSVTTTCGSKRRSSNATAYHRYRVAVLDHYGHACTFCGESEDSFLCIMHSNRNGAEFRRKHGGGSTCLYTWLIANNFPPTFQTACYNCILKTMPRLTRVSHLTPSALRKWQKYYERKNIAISYYGALCACCGESDLSCLTIDHINNNGAAHRQELGTRVIYKWLITNNFPGGFQVLCFNCNRAKAKCGACPHQRGASVVGCILG